MRMRRKKHLEERLSGCGDMIIYMDREDKNYQNKAETSFIDVCELFGNDNPVILEVGCGKGQFVRELAKAHPEFNYLAVEKASNVIVDAAEKTIEEGIKNIRFMRGGAEYLDCYIPEKLIEKIYLNFSCPFPKKKYAMHRLTHRNFLAIYEKLLKDGGEIAQKTDNMGLFEFSIEEFSQSGWGLKEVSLDLHNSGFEGNIMTEYEKRFTDLGQPIYRLVAFKNKVLDKQEKV